MNQRANRACAPVAILVIVFNLISVLRAAEDAVQPTGGAKQVAAVPLANRAPFKN